MEAFNVPNPYSTRHIHFDRFFGHFRSITELESCGKSIILSFSCVGLLCGRRVFQWIFWAKIEAVLGQGHKESNNVSDSDRILRELVPVGIERRMTSSHNSVGIHVRNRGSGMLVARRWSEEGCVRGMECKGVRRIEEKKTHEGGEGGWRRSHSCST
jgi:hypothetical protein